MADRRDLEQRIESLEAEVARLKRSHYRGVRKRASFTIFGLPAYDIASGPDTEKGELRGHAKGFLAIGDIATGVVAVGGVAHGLLAIGGLAIGVVSLGGASIGLALALGGGAFGGVAVGGGAVGGVAVGAGSAGYYAVGTAAAGKYVWDSRRHDREVEELFERHGLPCPRELTGELPRRR